MKTSVRCVCVFLALFVLACCGLPLSGQSPSPVPLINDPLVPTSVAPGGAGFTLTVNGTGFVSGAVVNWNGTPRTTHFVSNSQLTATIPATDIGSASTSRITVTNPGPGGGASNVGYLEITNTAPKLAFTPIFANDGANVPFGQPAVADFNGDGKLDLAIPDNSDPYGTGAVAVLLGNGDGTFKKTGNFTVDIADSFVIAADFNGDGKPDLATANSGQNTVSILLGNGDGTFQPQRSLPVSQPSGGPSALVAGDFNGDGKLDLAVVGGTQVTVLLGNGDGTFQTPTKYALPASANGIVAGDFNGDGKLDLALSPTYILLGNGDGTFQLPNQSNVGGSALMAAADVNHDGKLDLITVTISPSSLNVYLGNGDGTFKSGASYPPGGSETVSFAIGDFNADGNLDCAVVNANGGTAPSANASILLGNGDGTFQIPISTNLGNPQVSPFSAVSAGDFNGDGKVDLAVTSISTGQGSTLITLLQGQFPSLTASPYGLFFAQQAVGTTSPAQAMTFTNSGTATMSLSASSIAIVGANASDFSQTNTCSGMLAPGATCQVNVAFTPAAVGSPTAALSVSDDAPGSPQLVPLGGSTPAAPVVSPTPSTVSFASQYVGTSGLPQTVTVTNTGDATLTIAAVTASPADFGVLSNCTNPVAVGANCTIGVFFDPTTGGTRTGTLTITDNAAGSPQTVTLTGSGEDFSVNPGSAATATVGAGQTANYSIAVAPAGGFAQSVTLSCSGGPAGSTCAVSPSTIALSGAAAQTAMVTVTTATHGWVLPFESGWPQGTRYRQTPMILILAGMFLMVIASLFGRREQNLAWVRVAAFAALVTLGLTLTSCGGGSASSGGGTNPQAGTYTINVTGNFTTGSTTLTHAAKLTLVVQ